MKLLAFSKKPNRDLNNVMIRVMGVLGNLDLNKHVCTYTGVNMKQPSFALGTSGKLKEFAANDTTSAFIIAEDHVLKHTYPNQTAVLGYFQDGNSVDTFSHAKINNTFTYSETVQKRVLSKATGTLSFVSLNKEGRMITYVGHRVNLGSEKVTDFPLFMLATLDGIFISSEASMLSAIKNVETAINRATTEVKKLTPGWMYALKDAKLSSLYQV